uniref:JmjC domain-containing protein n=1 Tax=Trichobilharzia regenti TaxID=157069 RepID=A0AA85JPR0_TRIRE|nr:unnamed protein product [Trichobilharzia regenti]
MMMVTAHAQRSTSSGSNSSTSTTTGGSRSRSSSSLRSVEGGTGAPAGSGGGGDCSDNDAYRHSSSSSSTIQSKNSTDRQLPYSRMTSYNKSNHLKDIMTMNSCNHLLTPSGGSPTGTHSSIDSTHGGGVGSTSGGSRKPKRTAALAASIATSVSTVKKPRLSSSSSSSSSKHRNDTGKGKNRYKDNPHNHNADDVDDNDIGDESSSHGCLDVKEESTDQDDVISIISGNSCEQPMPNELSAALAEENLQFEELAKQLPGPPDLNRTANKSLHSTHSLNFYKRSQRVFVQLISCSDVGLKQVPKCRACRHARVTYHNSPSNCINGVDDSDDDYSESKHALFNQDVNSSSNDDQNSYSDESRKVGQFKRPPPGRSSSSSVSEKNRKKERTTTEKLLKDNKRNVTHHSPSPVSVFCRFWGFRKLCYNNRGVLKIADFCRSTESDALERSLWEMYHPVSPFLSAYAARYILECAGGLFCRLLHQELTSLNGNNSNHIEFQKITSLSGRNGKSSNTNAVNKNDDNNNHNNNNGGGDNTNLIAWKKPVKGVREMCDVCDTTMFNTHWVCAKCGYSVCTDCLDESKLTNSSMNSDRKVNENGTVVEKSKSKHSRGRGGGPHGWASCTTTRQHHDPNRLLLTSLLPSGIIGRLIHRLHRIANYHQINLGCHCSASAAGSSASSSSTSSSESSGGGDVSLKSTKTLDVVRGDGVDRNSLDLLADIALKTDESNSTPTATTITSTTTTTTTTPSTTTHNSPNSTTTTTTTTNDTDVSTANRIIDSTTPPMMDNGGIKLVMNNDNKNNNHNKRISNIPSHNWIHSRNSTGQKSCQKMNELTNHHHNNNNTNSISNNGSDLHKDLDVVKSYQTKQVNHLHHLQQSHQHQNRHPAVLRLHHPDSPGVLLQFQSEWRHNHPLVISGCQRKFNQELWTPQSFSDDFGELKTTLVDCATGAEITRYCLKSFWDGFERHERRITSKDGRALCLKLKDWPTTDDFAELQPKRFSDLMSNLPMPDYTRRDGQLNLAARLASFFVCPDLGPKLYVAYGTVGSNAVSTTNLHVDIADAVNVMLCVGQPIDSSKDMLTNAENVLNTLKCSRVDNSYLDRTVSWLNRLKSCHNNNNNNNREFGFDDVPGALWHIFLPEDSVVLREFLSRVSEEETGSPVESGSDPIHDQLFYLDQSLLDRLYDYAGIQPCTIVQFLGDAVFIPAGAAHQVRNLNSCIKTAVDFVSPEHLPQCFQLLEEFRQLSPNHLNREDKLQIKNMLFHGIKDALSVLLTTNSNSNGSNENEVKCYKSLTMDSEHKLSQCTTTKIDGIDHRQDNVDNRPLPSSDMSDIKVNIKSEYLHNNNNNNNGNSNTNVMKSSNHNSRNGGNNGGGRTRGRPGGGGAAAAAGGGRSKAPSSSSDLINPPLAPPPPSAPHLHPQSFTSSSVSSMSSSCSSISNAFSSVFTPGIDNSLLTNSLNIPSRDSMCTASSPASLSSSSEKIMKSGDIIKPNNNNNLMITTHPSNNYDCDRIPPITTTTTNISSSTCSPSPSTTTLSSSPDILHIPASSSCFTSSSSSSLLPSLSCGSLSCQHHLQHQQHPHHCQQPQHQNGCTGHFS